MVVGLGGGVLVAIGVPVGGAVTGVADGTGVSGTGTSVAVAGGIVGGGRVAAGESGVACPQPARKKRRKEKSAIRIVIGFMRLISVVS